jgi:ADP-ribose pyrophosphatase YjhB (NUDIX family)
MGFSLGTGGAVLLNNRLLMVHHTYEPKVWRIPGGYVKPEEAAHDACIREIFEETQIRTKVDGFLISVKLMMQDTFHCRKSKNFPKIKCPSLIDW